MLPDHGVPAKPEGSLATPLPRRPSATRVRWLIRALDVTLPAQAAPRSGLTSPQTASGSDAPRVRIQPLIEGYFALHETFRFSTRTIQRMLKRIANRARISRVVSPHVLRHTFAVTATRKESPCQRFSAC